MMRGRLLARYGLGGPARDPGLDAVAAAAALVCAAPYAFVSVLDDELEWVKGRHGASVASVSPASSFCEMVVRSRATVITEDALARPEVADDPLVTGRFGIRFHVGVPLRGTDGDVLGSLCVLDTEPREVTPVQLQVLERLAIVVSAQFAARLGRSDAERAAGSEHRTALESLPVGYARTELNGVVTDANQEFCRIVGQPLHRVLGLRAADLHLTTDADSARIRKDLADLVSGRESVVRAHRSYRHADGTVVPVFVTTALTRDDDGLPNGFLGFLIDVSAQHELRVSQERFRTGFMSSPIGMALLTTDRVFVEVNDELCRIFGYEREELVGTALEALMEPDEVTDLHRRFDVAGQTGGWQWRAERTYRGKDGRRIIGQVSAARVDDGTGGHLMLGQVEDVTRQRTAEHELARRSLHDDLTGLGNRALLEEQLTRALRRAAARQRPLAVLMCDLDGFGLVNEALGHRAGDLALRLTADRLRLAAPRGSTLARVGGDEFVLVAEDTDEAGADAL
ncbi:MAG: domain S-box protein, partial [Frankiales bacterium]|nr:domain S-box protein [Frankiales bacterium]